MPAAAPTPPSERNAALDVLHGLAFLGVVMVDTPMFFRPVWEEFLPAPPPGATAADAAARAAVQLLFQTKALTMFAVLFGASFSILRDNFARRGDPGFVPHFARRMTALLLLGILQGVLLWFNSVLSLLAGAGLACLALEPLLPRARRRAAWALFAAGLAGAAAAILASSGAAHGSRAYFYHLGYLIGFEDAVYSGGTWRAVTAHRAAAFLVLIPPALLLFGARLLAATLAGIGLQEAGLWRDSPGARAFWSRWLRLGLLLGAPLQAAAVALERVREPSVGVVLGRWTGLYLGSALLAAAYLGAGCLWCWRSPGGSAPQRLLARAGRMSLTNFLAFIAAGSLLAYPYGAGLYGRVGAAAALGLGAALYAALLAADSAWLSRFKFGPAERLLRAAAYARGTPGRPSGP